MRKLKISSEERKNILRHPESIANMITGILSCPGPIKDVCMDAIGLGDKVVENFRERIGQGKFHQPYNLFKTLESFFDTMYTMELGVYSMNENWDGELLIGDQTMYKRDVHLGEDDTSKLMSYRNERLSIASGRFEYNGPIYGEGGKGAVMINLPWGGNVILSFGNMGSDPWQILKIRQWFEKGGFDQIIRTKLEIAYRVYRDSLTWLYNREYFYEIITKSPYSIIYIDLNNFKVINDAFGHSTGDKLLRELATIFKWSIRKNDKACRLWGDEFLILVNTIEEPILKDITTAIRSKVHANKFVQSLNEKINPKIGIAIGYCMFQIEVPIEERIEIAERRMYEDKQEQYGEMRDRRRYAKKM